MKAEEHRSAAESLLNQAQEEFERLRAVPARGITRFEDGHIEEGHHFQEENAVYHLSQRERRDELGHSITGKYAMAQVHATLYLGDMQAEANQIAARKP